MLEASSSHFFFYTDVCQSCSLCRGRAAPQQRRSATVAARAAFDPVTSWRQQRESQRRAQKAVPEWRGGADTGATTDNDFSANHEISSRSAVLGGKNLRAVAGQSESATLNDEPLGVGFGA